MDELGYKKIGEGEKKVFFLHELMGDHRNYDPILPYLNQKDFTYYFIDHRGYGFSRDISGEYTCLEAANDVKNLITKLGLDEVYLVAHSMSTMIAQKIALIDSRIKMLILTTPISAAGVKMGELQKKTLLEGMRENKSAVEKIVNESSKRYNDTWREYRIDMGYSSSTVEARVGYMNMYLTTDFLSEAEQNITVPIKIIVGIHDFKVFAKKMTEKNYKNYKNIEIVECGESGHYPMIETPVFYATKIEEFINNIAK